MSAEEEIGEGTAESAPPAAGEETEETEQAPPAPAPGPPPAEPTAEPKVMADDDDGDEDDDDKLRAEKLVEFSKEQDRARTVMKKLEDSLVKYEADVAAAEGDEEKRKKLWQDFRKVVEVSTAEVHKNMRDFEAHPGVQERACRLLKRLSPYMATYDQATGSKKKSATGDTEQPLVPTSPLEGASIALLLTAIRVHRDVVPVIRQTCAALEAVCRAKEANRVRTAADYRGVQVVVLHVLRRHADNAVMQRWGCCVLAALLDGQARTHREANRDRVIRGGGVACVLEAMKNHLEDPPQPALALACVSILATLCKGDGPNNPRAAVGSEGGAAGILQTLRRHSDSEQIQERACAALWHVADEPFEITNRKLFISEGAVALVVKSMKQYKSSQALQCSGCGCLGSLAARHNPNRVKVTEDGGMEAILEAMKIHEASTDVQEWGCRALWTLVVDDSNKNKLVEAGGIPLLLKAITTHPENVLILRNACGCLWNLARHSPESVQVIMEGDGLAIVKESAERYKNDLCKLLLKKLKAEDGEEEEPPPSLVNKHVRL